METNLTKEERLAILKVLASNNKNVQFNTTYLKYADQALTLVVIRDGDTLTLSAVPKAKQ